MNIHATTPLRIPLIKQANKSFLKLEKIYLGPNINQTSINKFRDNFTDTMIKVNLGYMPEIDKSLLDEQLI